MFFFACFIVQYEEFLVIKIEILLQNRKNKTLGDTRTQPTVSHITAQLRWILLPRLQCPSNSPAKGDILTQATVPPKQQSGLGGHSITGYSSPQTPTMQLMWALCPRLQTLSNYPTKGRRQSTPWYSILPTT